jgi:hypothetical protein
MTDPAIGHPAYNRVQDAIKLAITTPIRGSQTKEKVPWGDVRRRWGQDKGATWEALVRTTRKNIDNKVILEQMVDPQFIRWWAGQMGCF